MLSSCCIATFGNGRKRQMQQLPSWFGAGLAKRPHGCQAAVTLLWAAKIPAMLQECGRGSISMVVTAHTQEMPLCSSVGTAHPNAIPLGLTSHSHHRAHCFCTAFSTRLLRNTQSLQASPCCKPKCCNQNFP